MKNKVRIESKTASERLMAFGRRAIVILMLAAVSFVAAQAQDESRGGGSLGGGQLTGTWDAVVTLYDCNTGDPIRTFYSIGTFSKGGTFIGSTGGQPQASRTPEHGVWRHDHANFYRFRFKSFNFDPAGNFTGWSIISHTIELDLRNSRYVSYGTAQFFNPNGVQVAQGCSEAVATNFEL